MSILKEHRDYEFLHGELTLAWEPCYRAYVQTNEFFGQTPMGEEAMKAMLMQSLAFKKLGRYHGREALVFRAALLPENMRIMLLGQ